MSTTTLRPDLPTYTVEMALDMARKDHNEVAMVRVVIIGEHEDGGLYVKGSRCNRAEMNWLMDRAKHHAIGIQYVMDDEESGEYDD